MRRTWPKGTWMKLTSKDTLRSLIKQRSLSYGDIADTVDCHRSMISQLTNGHRTSCTPQLAKKIAICLNVPIEVLFVEQASAASGRSVTAGRTAA